MLMLGNDGMLLLAVMPSCAGGRGRGFDPGNMERIEAPSAFWRFVLDAFAEASLLFLGPVFAVLPALPLGAASAEASQGRREGEISTYVWCVCVCVCVGGWVDVGVGVWMCVCVSG